MLFNNTYLCIWGGIFGLIVKFFKISILNILIGQRRDMTELKLVWPINTTGQRSKLFWALFLFLIFVLLYFIRSDQSYKYFY